MVSENESRYLMLCIRLMLVSQSLFRYLYTMENGAHPLEVSDQTLEACVSMFL